MTATMRRLAAPALMLFALAGCSGGGLGDILGGVLNSPSSRGGTATLDVEIVANDTQRQLLQVRTNDGREGVIRWDSGTEVVYNNERYSAAALERGDLVQMRVQETRDGELYTDYVYVTRSAQERRYR